jgi:tRNA(Ile2) C34 agmatinyltransferase TiaS
LDWDRHITMTLSDRLHCPDCQGRLDSTSAPGYRCSTCDRAIPLVDGIADFIGALPMLPPGADRYREVSQPHGLLGADLPARIKAA